MSAHRLGRQRGNTAVEFGMSLVAFMFFMCGVIEMSRALFLWSTMAEVTRRAARGAADADFSDAAQLGEVRTSAMFGGTSIPFDSALAPAQLQIDYLNSNLNAVSPLPLCPADNIALCTANGSAPGCIRFVRVRLCEGNACTRLVYQPLMGTGAFPFGPIRYPTFATVTPAGAFGYRPGAATSCN